MTRYAEGTVVAADKSIAEIRTLLTKHGATHYAYGSGPDGDMVQFTLGGLHYRFDVTRPDAAALREEYVASALEGGQYEYAVTSRANRVDWTLRRDAEWRRRWRARLLWLKALLEFREDVPLEQSMLANLVLPDGQTFARWVGPQIEGMYADGKMPPLLAAGTGR